MISFIKSLLSGVILGAALIGVAYYTSPDRTPAPYVVSADGGGAIFDYLAKYNEIERSGRKVIIDGPCLSACTIALRLPEGQICATEKATFGFHEVAYQTLMGRVPLPVETRWFADYVYPEKVHEAFAKRGYDITKPAPEGSPFGMVFFSPGELDVERCD